MIFRLYGLRLSVSAPIAKAAAVFSVVVLSIMMMPGAQAASPGLADERAIRAVVEGQLAAFVNDDARKAYSFAAPNVRQAIGSAEAFMSMVRRDYPAVYRPASVAFLKPEGQGDEVLQRVQMIDAAGNAWLAVYSLQRQKSKLWLITGCVLQKNEGRMI
jgi:Domain of unknown function (DUF4864)